MKVFKFGGASVNSAQAVENMSSIVRMYYGEPLIVVVSAMGKTTNRLEQMVPGVNSLSTSLDHFEELKRYHLTIVDSLFPSKDHPIYSALERLFDLLDNQIRQQPTHYNFDYDQTVSFGELISTTIISHYLNLIGLKNSWMDIRKIITTDTTYREGRVDWEQTQHNVNEQMGELFPLTITQGFIAGSTDGHTTTLGREGSDYSASILSYCLHADEMTIWKDVPGFLNADPKFFPNTIKIQQIPYNEAIELAYYGASVIHPKTVKPIQNRNIRLNIRSFIDPSAEGSVIGPFKTILPQTPLYIFKNRQLLISFLPKDFSFIAEENLQTLFAVLAELNIKVNLMQNSALSFSICIDYNEILIKQLTERLQQQYLIRYNTDLQLITIRYYTQEIIDSIVAGRSILLEQRSRTTIQLIVASGPQLA